MRLLVTFAVVCATVSFGSAFAQGPPVGGPGAGAETVITKVIPDYSTVPATIDFYGESFGTSPLVSIGEVLGTLMVLTVNFANDTFIAATLPTGIEPGSYILVVESGTGPAHAGIIDLTIGAAGPQGLPGEQGLPGADGAAGPPGVGAEHVITEVTNTGVGIDVLQNPTAGASINNVAVGYRALKANTTGRDNTVLGFLALLINETGTRNTALAARSKSLSC